MDRSCIIKQHISGIYLTALMLVFFSFHNNEIKAEQQIDKGLFASVGFEENKGQIYDEAGKFRDDVHFVANFSGANVFFTDAGVVMRFYKVEPSEYMKISAGKIPNPYSSEAWEEIQKKISKGESVGDLVKENGEQYRIDITFPGAKFNKATGENEMLEKHNFFNPNHLEGLSNVPLFERIRYKDVYPGIDLVFYIQSGQLKYDFELAANAKPSLIKILYKGLQNISIDEKGNAVVKILPGEIIEKAPVCLQNGREIKSQFIISNDTLKFQLETYDTSLPLVIDPTLVWSTYFYDGTTSAAFSYTSPVWDSNGNMFLVFNTYNNTVFPLVNPGGSAYYNITPGNTGIQLIISKINTNRQIVWATYYSSTASTQIKFSNQSVAIDQNDNLYVIGSVFYVYGCPCTFPLYNPGGGAYYETEQGNNRNFILKFSSAGVRLWATMFNKTAGASSSGLELSGITIDKNNKLVVTGETYTPPSWNPMPLVNPGGSYYYKSATTESSVPSLHRFTTAGALEWGTYISQGSAGNYNGSYASVAVDASNNIFLTSAGSGPYTTVNPGGAYVNGIACGNGRKFSIFKFAGTGSLDWCTMYGGTFISGSMLWQDSRDIKIASNGDVFIVGRANATNFPFVNPGGGAYMKTTLSTGSSSVCDGVILQFSNNGAIKWATYYGGDGVSDGTDFMGLAIDAANNIMVSGISRSTLFPTQAKAGSYNQSTMAGSYAIVLAQFNSLGVRQWASYLGTETWMLTGGFGSTKSICGQTKYMQLGYIVNPNTITTLDPGNGAYYHATNEGATGQSDIFVEFTDGGIGGGGTPGVWGWTGASSTDWFEPCNWDKLSVPTATSPVIIFGAPSNKPVIASGNAHCLNIEIQTTSGAILTINTPAGNLEVHQ